MKVAMIGLGKLGLPVSCAMVMRHHEVYGFDNDIDKANAYRQGQVDLYEPSIGMQLCGCLAGDTGLHIVNRLEAAVRPAEIIFIAVPTPSRPDGGFDTSIVSNAVADVADIMKTCDDHKTVAIISTVLPTTVRNIILPVLEGIMGEPPGNRYGLCYNAQFIAMGSVVNNMLHPEFVLVGEYDQLSGDVLEHFYTQLTNAPVKRMTIESAEFVKMIYNTFIGMKIMYANLIGEMCDRIPNADCDVVVDALALARDRLISSRYLHSGLGDGGGCHPRDQRALAYFANALGTSHNLFQYIINARVVQTDYVAQAVCDVAEYYGMPIVVYGLTFKPETNLTEDSPALLLVDCIKRMVYDDCGVYLYDPIIAPDAELPDEPCVYVIGMRHNQIKDFHFNPGSIIIDPWRCMEPVQGCAYHPLGVGQGEDPEWYIKTNRD